MIVELEQRLLASAQHLVPTPPPPPESSVPISRGESVKSPLLTAADAGLLQELDEVKASVSQAIDRKPSPVTTGTAPSSSPAVATVSSSASQAPRSAQHHHRKKRPPLGVPLLSSTFLIGSHGGHRESMCSLIHKPGRTELLNPSPQRAIAQCHLLSPSAKSGRSMARYEPAGR